MIKLFELYKGSQLCKFLKEYPEILVLAGLLINFYGVVIKNTPETQKTPVIMLVSTATEVQSNRVLESLVQEF